MKLRLNQPGAQWAMGVDTNVILEIENDEAAPIEVPDPNDNCGWQAIFTYNWP